MRIQFSVFQQHRGVSGADRISITISLLARKNQGAGRDHETIRVCVPTLPYAHALAFQKLLKP
jgi:hypothetical protein